MAVKLSRSAYEHAQALIEQEPVEIDERNDWSEHQPMAEQENAFIEQHGFREYGRWYLGVDDEHDEETKGHYKFPYGDFERVHRCGVLAAESLAGRRGYADIESAAAHVPGCSRPFGRRGRGRRLPARARIARRSSPGAAVARATA